MKTSRLMLAALMVVGMATGARAMPKDICLYDGGTYLVYQKVKVLRPNQAVPLTGYAVGPFGRPRFTCPLSGTAIMTANGSVQVGNSVYCGSEPGLGNYNTQHSAHTNASFEGKYDADEDGDGFADYKTTYWAVDCSTVVTHP